MMECSECAKPPVPAVGDAKIENQTIKDPRGWTWAGRLKCFSFLDFPIFYIISPTLMICPVFLLTFLKFDFHTRKIAEVEGHQNFMKRL